MTVVAFQHHDRLDRRFRDLQRRARDMGYVLMARYGAGVKQPLVYRFVLTTRSGDLTFTYLDAVEDFLEGQRPGDAA